MAAKRMAPFQGNPGNAFGSMVQDPEKGDALRCIVQCGVRTDRTSECTVRMDRSSGHQQLED